MKRAVEAKLLRATFYILSKRQDQAFKDLEDVIETETADPKVRANALIKRASLYIQRCKDPQQDPLLSFKDFERATEIDPENSDVYHHRGQVSCTHTYIRIYTHIYYRSNSSKLVPIVVFTMLFILGSFIDGTNQQSNF